MSLLLNLIPIGLVVLSVFVDQILLSTTLNTLALILLLVGVITDAKKGEIVAAIIRALLAGVLLATIIFRLILH